jgi:hypothetical protein
MTVGLLAISASVGAMGGYYWRGKRVENNNLKEIENNTNFKVIESKPSQLKCNKN